MLTKRVLELSDVKRMASACEMLASEKGWAVAFAIVDDGGINHVFINLGLSPSQGSSFCFRNADFGSDGRCAIESLNP